jgi:signal transduction histidine kinase
MTFAARVKKGKWWKNTVLCRIILLLRRVLRALFHGLSTLVSNLPLLWKSILIFLAYLLINGITLLFLFNSAFAFLSFLFGILFNVAVFAGLCFLTLQLNRLKEGGARIASGDYSVKIDTTNMLWDLKSHGEALNNIGQGMLKAVDERLRSERLKTELITNVSHDIKTPLTSIVNYVDLLKKEPLESETAREYIEVLDRQSQRLKKLVEDLLEASKASAGSIQVSTSSLDIVELLNQSLGEYTEQFSINGLEPIIRTPPEPVRILADGKLMWRVFDNLLNNICKYSLPHTRVYFDVDITDRDVSLTLKNISRYPLNISADELMERFVRGDTARTTEGSGLGLSITKSLIELQKGGFTLSVDGDLFKATIRFPRENHAS